MSKRKFQFISPGFKPARRLGKSLIPGCLGQHGDNPVIAVTGPPGFFRTLADQLGSTARAYYVSHGDKRRQLEVKVKGWCDQRVHVLLHFAPDYEDFDFWTYAADGVFHGLSPTRARVIKLRDADDSDKVLDLSELFPRIVDRWEA